MRQSSQWWQNWQCFVKHTVEDIWAFFVCLSGLALSFLTYKINYLCAFDRHRTEKKIDNLLHVKAMRKLIMEDQHVTYREIEETMCITMITIHKILHEHLWKKLVHVGLRIIWQLPKKSPCWWMRGNEKIQCHLQYLVRWRILKKCVLTRHWKVVDCVGLPKRAKSIKVWLYKEHFEANGGWNN